MNVRGFVGPVTPFIRGVTSGNSDNQCSKILRTAQEQREQRPRGVALMKLGVHISVLMAGLGSEKA